MMRMKMRKKRKRPAVQWQVTKVEWLETQGSQSVAFKQITLIVKSGQKERALIINESKKIRVNDKMMRVNKKKWE